MKGIMREASSGSASLFCHLPKLDKWHLQFLDGYSLLPAQFLAQILIRGEGTNGLTLER